MTIKPRTFIEDDRAVSPVIGVILMVAITVILAAVIGTFVLDLGQQTGQAAPQASLSVDVSTASDTITLNHEGGASLLSTESRVIITNESASSSLTWDEGSTDDAFSVGESADFDVTSTAAPSGWSLTANSNTFSGGIQAGIEYTVTVIDTDSDKVIFESSFVA